MVKSGVAGLMFLITTVHADSARGAVDQLSLLVLQAGLNLGRAESGDYVRGIVDVFVQLTRREGRRTVSQIVFKGTEQA